MPKIQATQTINVDGVPFIVERMTPQIQQMISMMDDWRQDEVDTTSKLTMIKAALRDLQNNIYVAVKAEQEKAKNQEEKKMDDPVVDPRRPNPPEPIHPNREETN